MAKIENIEEVKQEEVKQPKKKGMKVTFGYNNDFVDFWEYLQEKYPEEIFRIQGVHNDNFDISKFSKNFFKNTSTTADVSVDANANVVAKTGVEYNFELAKPLKRYNSYYLLWKELRKQFGHQTANEIIELQLTGAIYINDFTDVALPLKNNTEHKQKKSGEYRTR